jgi:hypothetical protein
MVPDTMDDSMLVHMHSIPSLFYMDLGPLVQYNCQTPVPPNG